MFRLTILAVCVIGALGAATPKMRYDNFQVFEVHAKSTEDVMRIKALEDGDAMELDFWQEGGRHIPAHICVAPQHRQELLDTLTEMGLEHKVVVANVQDQIDAVDEIIARTPPEQRNIQAAYYDYQANVDYLEALRAQNDDIMSISNYGKSREQRDLFYVKISSERFSSPDPAHSTKPTIWIEAATHAREWITNAVALNLITWLVENHDKDSDAIEMLAKYDWFIVPVHNPDGYDFSHRSVRLWRKTTSSGSCSTTSSGNGNGVDSNRNWNFKWGTGTTSQCSSTYQGPSAFSEITNSAMAAQMERTPSQYRKGFFSLHSYSQFILTPYAFDRREPVHNYAEQLRVANAARSAILANSGTNFIVGKPGDILYNAPGGAYDYALGALDYTYSLTYELHPASANPGFVLPPSSIMPSFGDFLASIIAISREMN